jgi:hypothetical protein
LHGGVRVIFDAVSGITPGSLTDICEAIGSKGTDIHRPGLSQGSGLIGRPPCLTVPRPGKPYRREIDGIK